METAVWLAKLGKQVSVVEFTDQIMGGTKNTPIGDIEMAHLYADYYDIHMEFIQTWGCCCQISVCIRSRWPLLKELPIASLKTVKNFPAPCFSRWTKCMITLIFAIRSILHSRSCTGSIRETTRRQQSGRHF